MFALKDLLSGFIKPPTEAGVVRIAELQSQGYLYLRPPEPQPSEVTAPSRKKQPIVRNRYRTQGHRYAVVRKVAIFISTTSSAREQAKEGEMVSPSALAALFVDDQFELGGEILQEDRRVLAPLRILPTIGGPPR